MTSIDKVVSLFQFDHNILHGIEVNDEHWNYTPTLILPHREKSKADTAKVAKAMRIDKNLGAAVRAIRAGEKPPKRVSKFRRPSGGKTNWPQGRKIQSRGFR